MAAWMSTACCVSMRLVRRVDGLGQEWVVGTAHQEALEGQLQVVPRDLGVEHGLLGAGHLGHRLQHLHVGHATEADLQAVLRQELLSRRQVAALDLDLLDRRSAAPSTPAAPGW